MKPLRSKAMLASAMSLMTGWRKPPGPAAVNVTEPPGTPYAAGPGGSVDLKDCSTPTYSLIGW